MIKLKRTVTRLREMSEGEDSYMSGTPQERISFMGELTEEIWSLKDRKNAQQRLQRHITKLIKK